MNVVLWAAQIVLAGIFAASGAMKSTMSKQRMIETGQTGVAPFPLPVVRVVALLELVAVLGLILPWLTGVARVLTPLAAVGLAVVMVGAAIAHSTLREPKAVAANAVIFAMCLVVIVGRLADLG